MPDYPGAAGRTGYAVGLDVPSSVIAMLHDLKKAGYAVEGIAQSPREIAQNPCAAFSRRARAPSHQRPAFVSIKTSTHRA